MAEINWSQLQKDATDVVLPDGDYVAMVTKADASESSNKKPMLKLQLTIVEGPKRDRKVFTQIVLTADNPFALQRWFANLAAFGLDHGYFGCNPSMEQIATDLMNRGVIITLSSGEWQGSLRNEVQKYKPFAPNGPTPPGMVLGTPTAGPTTPITGPSAPPTPSAPPAGPPIPPSVPQGAQPPAPPAAPPARPF